MSDPVVLSYGDALLRASDLQILQSDSGWLNDRIIGYVFEYLETETFAHLKSQLALVTPDVTQLIKLYSGEELTAALEPLSLSEKELVLLAVNNSSSVTSAGGSHWSLLVYIRSEDTFKHFDSLQSCNLLAAEQCAAKLAPLVKCESARVVSVKCPQQTNGYDCGVYLVCFAEHVVRQVLLKDAHTLQQAVDPATVKQWRQKTLTSIHQKQKR